MIDESYIIRFKGFIDNLSSVLEMLHQNGHIKKKSKNGKDIFYIDEKAAVKDEQIKRIVNKETLFALHQIIDEDINVYEYYDGTDNPYTCYDGNRIGEAASEQLRSNLYDMNPSYLETYICDVLGYFIHNFPYLQEPIDESKVTVYQYDIDYLKNIHIISRKLMPCLEEREMIDINRLERVIYYAFEDFKDFIDRINKYIEMFNLNPENINKKINYNLFNQPDTLITPDKLCLDLKVSVNKEKLYKILIEQEYISPKTNIEDFYCLFNNSGSISHPIRWIKKTSKKQRSKASLNDFLILAGINSTKLHDKTLIAKYFLDDEGRPMQLNLFNNKSNEKSEYYNELKEIIKKVSIK